MEDKISISKNDQSAVSRGAKELVLIYVYIEDDRHVVLN